MGITNLCFHCVISTDVNLILFTYVSGPPSTIENLGHFYYGSFKSIYN